MVIQYVQQGSGVISPAGNGGSAGTLVDKAYQALRQDIMWGKLVPGVRLKIEHLRREYGIGPTPIREALSRLVAEGLLVGEAHRGFRVPPVSLEDLADIVAQRTVLECSALEGAIQRGDDEWESRVLAAYHRMTRVEERGLAAQENPWEEWELRHREFHEALIGGAGSQWSQRLLRILYDQGDRYRRLYRAQIFITPTIQHDHERILAATLGRDAGLAVAEMARHIARLNEGATVSEEFRKTYT